MPVNIFILYKDFLTELTVSAESHNFNESSLLATKEGRLKAEITLKVFLVVILEMCKSIYFKIVLRLSLIRMQI